MLSFAAISATIYSNHLVIAARAKEQARILYIREQLGIFIAQGTNLLNLAATASVPANAEQAIAWGANAESFFAANMGDAYVFRFRDSTGMPPEYISGVDEQHQNLWRDIYSRILKLEQFIKESPW